MLTPIVISTWSICI